MMAVSPGAFRSQHFPS